MMAVYYFNLFGKCFIVSVSVSSTNSKPCQGSLVSVASTVR
jgi:hypothetical protein